MKLRSLTLALSILTLAAACQKSEISDKPAAEVSDTGTTITADSTSTEAGTVAGNVIKEKSSMDWVAGKVTRDHNGAFKTFDGSIQYAGDKPSSLHFDIDLTSVEADEPKLTEHLKSADFFDVARFPKATFHSTSLDPAPAGSPAGVTHMLKGILDLHGVQKEVTIPVTAQVTPEGVQTRSEFTINRHDWGISYRGMADDLIRDNVLIKLNLAFPPPPAAT